MASVKLAAASKPAVAISFARALISSITSFVGTKSKPYWFITVRAIL
jgi:hypothetical protein